MSDRLIQGASVLVTGGAGFIGSNLCADLLQHGNKVTCLDNFCTGNRRNIVELLENRNFRLIEGDIRIAADCAKAVKGIDIVLQQAALGSVPRSIHDPVATNEVNVSGFLNMLVAARDAGVKRFVYAGSSSSYGDLAESPKVENKRGDPLSPYAVSKLSNELYAHVFYIHYGLPVVGLRYFNVFGKNQSPDGEYAAAIPRFIKSLIRHEPPTIFGDGSSSRDFTYIANVIKMNHLAATSSNDAVLGQVFNTATGSSATLNELLAILKELLINYDPEIAGIEAIYLPARKGDIPHSLASIEKARKMLGYTPLYNLRDGLKEAVSWYWKNLG